MLANVNLLIFQFLSENSVNPLHTQLFISVISDYHLFCLLRNATILLDHFTDTISVSLISFCLWYSITLLVRHLQHNTEWYWCLHNHLHKQLSFNNESQSVEHFLQSKTHSLHGVYSTLTLSLYTLHHFHGCISKTYSGTTMETGTKVRESLTEWVQFSSHNYVGLFLRKKNWGIIFQHTLIFL
jgi:hypothetical protein